MTLHLKRINILRGLIILRVFALGGSKKKNVGLGRTSCNKIVYFITWSFTSNYAATYTICSLGVLQRKPIATAKRNIHTINIHLTNIYARVFIPQFAAERPIIGWFSDWVQHRKMISIWIFLSFIVPSIIWVVKMSKAVMWPRRYKHMLSYRA